MECTQDKFFGDLNLRKSHFMLLLYSQTTPRRYEKSIIHNNKFYILPVTTSLVNLVLLFKICCNSTFNLRNFHKIKNSNSDIRKTENFALFKGGNLF